MADNFESLLMDLVKGGKASPELINQIRQAMYDPSRMDELTEILTGLGGAEIEEPLEIADYYHEGDGRRLVRKYELGVPLPVPFEMLDRKTQFFTLFAEWQRREAEGMMTLTNGNLREAETIFEECLARAEQIEVGELRARSYEGLRRIAERKNDLESIELWCQRAQEARSGGA